jgi:hypothetical protein
MNAPYRQPRPLIGHPQPASVLPLVSVQQRIEELRQQRALVEKAIAALTEFSRRRDFRRRGVKESI